MRMKRVLVFAILLFSTVLLVGCGKKGDAVILGPEESVVRVGSNFDPLRGITANDEAKGDFTSKITYEGTVDTEKVGVYTLTYKVKGSNGKEATLVRKIEVKDVQFIGFEEVQIPLGSFAFNPRSGVSVIDTELGTLRPLTDKTEEDEYFEIEGEVDTTKIGVYHVVYKFSIGDEYYKEITRTIVVANEAKITVPSTEDKIEIGSNFNPLLNVTATRPIIVEEEDEETGEITERPSTENVTENIAVDGSVDVNQPGTYVLTYRIEDPDNPLEFLKDEDGNVIEVKRTVEVYIRLEIEGVRPTVSVTQGGEFDPLLGVTVYDSVATVPKEKIEIIGDYNLDVIGTYTLFYYVSVTDEYGFRDAEVEVVLTVQKPVEGKQEVVIMAGDVREVDPFHENYTGRQQAQRQELQDFVEEKYNVEVIYKAYPSNAGWGPDRINALIQAGISGEPLADVFYHVTTDWLGQLSKGGAIAPINNFIGEGKLGEKVNPAILDAARIKDNYYGFSTGALNLEAGLYFNVDLLDELGIPNPAQLYLDGNWKWSDFKAWAVDANNVLKSKGEDYSTLGGAIAYYGENMVPLNGGQFIDMAAGEVRFAEEAAMETYDFIRELYEAELFEAKRTYDAGSAEWQGGKVLMHPGDLWFVKADNRWGKLGFELGFVPYPMADDYEGDYRSPIFGSSIFYLSSGHTQEKNELAFNVWVELQIWESELSPEESFRLSLADKFEDDLYIDAYMTVYDRGYVEFLNSIGVGAYSQQGLKIAINGGIAADDYRTRIDSIKEVYETFLGQFLQ